MMHVQRKTNICKARIQMMSHPRKHSSMMMKYNGSTQKATSREKFSETEKWSMITQFIFKIHVEHKNKLYQSSGLD